MLVESIALIAIVFALAFAFLRAGKKDFSMGLLPLLILPGVNIFISYISKFFSKLLDIEYNITATCTILVALVATCILIGTSGWRFKKKVHRTIYFLLCGLFALVLGIFFILNVMK